MAGVVPQIGSMKRLQSPDSAAMETGNPIYAANGTLSTVKHKAEVNHEVYSVSNQDGLACIQVVWAGISGSGATLTLEHSLNGVNWSQFPTNSTHSPAGASGTHIFNVSGFVTNLIRLTWTKGSVTDGTVEYYAV